MRREPFCCWTRHHLLPFIRRCSLIKFAFIITHCARFTLSQKNLKTLSFFIISSFNFLSLSLSLSISHRFFLRREEDPLLPPVQEDEDFFLDPSPAPPLEDRPTVVPCFLDAIPFWRNFTALLYSEVPGAKRLYCPMCSGISPYRRGTCPWRTLERTASSSLRFASTASRWFLNIAVGLA